MALDLTKPVQTLDGRKVEILRTDLRRDRYPVLGIITHPDGEECSASWDASGKIYHDATEPSNMDLVNVPEPKQKLKFWLNVYRDDCVVYRTEESAKAAAMPSCFAIAYPIEIEV